MATTYGTTSASKSAAGLGNAAQQASARITQSFNAAGRASVGFAGVSSKTAQAVVASNDRIASSVDGISNILPVLLTEITSVKLKITASPSINKSRGSFFTPTIFTDW